MTPQALALVALGGVLAAALTAAFGLVPGLFGAAAVLALATRLRPPPSPLGRCAEVLRAVAEGDSGRRLYLGAHGEERAVNEALDALEERLRLLGHDRTRLLVLVDELDDAILLVDAAHRITLANRAAKALARRAELIGVHVFSALPERAVLDLLADAGRGRAGRRRLGLEGRRYEAQAFALPGVGETVLVLSDRTEEDRLQRMRADFVANASHELRTPLTLISGYAEALLDPEGGEEERARFARVIHREAHRLARLVDDLLTLSQAEGASHLPLERLPLSAPIAHAVVRLVPAAAAKRLRLRLRGTFGEAALAQASAVESILVNLLDNAVRHSPTGETVLVEVAPAGHEMTLVVADRGEGIPEAELARIFERFYRVDKSHGRQGGAGLGLAIARHLAEAMGGRITVESRPGAGARFTLWLARAAGASSDGEEGS